MHKQLKQKPLIFMSLASLSIGKVRCLLLRKYFFMCVLLRSLFPLCDVIKITSASLHLNYFYHENWIFVSATYRLSKWLDTAEFYQGSIHSDGKRCFCQKKPKMAEQKCIFAKYFIIILLSTCPIDRFSFQFWI